MNKTPPPQQPRTLLGQITQVAKRVQAKINFSKLKLKPNARVPEFWVQESKSPTAKRYPLLGDYYRLGRSSKACDIVVRNAVVSQTHLSLRRNSRRRSPFVIQDENSTNGIYQGKRRVTRAVLHHGDIFTLGPPELVDAVKVQYYDPPPWYYLAFRYSL